MDKKLRKAMKHKAFAYANIGVVHVCNQNSNIQGRSLTW